MIFQDLIKKISIIEQFKNNKPLLMIFFILTIIILLKILSLVFFPIPEYLHAADIPSHIKRIELIKQDLKYFAYEPYYPKGFHLVAAGLSFLMGVGNAITLITIVSTLLFVFFTYKLAVFFSNDRFAGALTAFLSVTVSILVDVMGVPTPVPQTVGMAFLVMTLYFFVSGKYIPAAILLAVHSFFHQTWVLSAFLIFAWFVLNNKITLQSVKQKILPAFGLLFAFIFLYNSVQLFFSPSVITPKLQADLFIPTDHVKLKFFDLMISPLSLHAVTSPPFIFFLAFLGVFFVRKNFDKKKLFVLFWFIVLLLASQSYWVFDDFQIGFAGIAQSAILIGSRMLVYTIFPLSFFSAHALAIIKSYDLGGKLFVAFILMVLFFSSIPSFAVKPDFTQKELSAIEELRKLPVDAVVLSDPVRLDIILMGLKVSPYTRDIILIEAGLQPADINHLDYVLVEYPEKFVVHSLSGSSGNVFSKTGSKIYSNYSTDKSLASYVNAFMVSSRPYIPIFRQQIKIISTDTGEEVCYSDSNSLPSNCNNGDYFTIMGKKTDLSSLFDSYFETKTLYNSFAYLYRNKKISFEPDLNVTIGDSTHAESLKKSAFAFRWVNQHSELSKPNLFFGKLFTSFG